MPAEGGPPSREEAVDIVNRQGMHLRPATKFAAEALRFRADVRVRLESGGDAVNGKSTLLLSCLGAERGARLVIRADGEDADAAVEALVALVRAGFGDGSGV